MRVIFMGTPEFAVPVLRQIVKQGHEVAAVYTRAPKPAGRRGLETLSSDVHEAAVSLRLPVLTPQSLDSEEAAASFARHRAEVAIVVAYGLILPKAILDAPERGCLNLHASLLPRWRGAAPIERAIMAGDRETGVVVMRMEEGLDTGPVTLAERVSIGPDTTAGELRAKLAELGAGLVARALAQLDRLTFTPQAREGATHASKLANADARIAWAKSAAELHNLVRALSPRPGAVFEADFGKGPERIKVLRSRPVQRSGEPGLVLDDQLTVGCGTGSLQLLELQRAGKSLMRAAEFLRGRPILAGTRFPDAG